jgi:hypothetical protein
MESREIFAMVFKFVGLRLIVPSFFDFDKEPTLLSVNSRNEMLLTDLSRSLRTIYNRTGKTALLIKAK